MNDETTTKLDAYLVDLFGVRRSEGGVSRYVPYIAILQSAFIRDMDKTKSKVP